MALFLYSAVAKLIDFEEFSSELAKSPFVNKWSSFLPWVVPVIEIVVGLLLLNKNTRIYSLYSYFFIMICFTAYVYLMMKKAYYLPCACGGLIGSGLTWNGHLILNFIFSAMAFIAILLERKYQWENGKRYLPPKINVKMQ